MHVRASPTDYLFFSPIPRNYIIGNCSASTNYQSNLHYQIFFSDHKNTPLPHLNRGETSLSPIQYPLLFLARRNFPLPRRKPSRSAPMHSGDASLRPSDAVTSLRPILPHRSRSRAWFPESIFFHTKLTCGGACPASRRRPGSARSCRRHAAAQPPSYARSRRRCSGWATSSPRSRSPSSTPTRAQGSCSAASHQGTCE